MYQTFLKPKILRGSAWSLPYCILSCSIFFVADGYHHHVATNTWRATNILPNSVNIVGQPGLDHFAIWILDNDKKKDSLESHLMVNGISFDERLFDLDFCQQLSFYIYDYDGIKIQFIFLVIVLNLYRLQNYALIVKFA
ncbi:VOC family protein [Candidatus Nitrosocosmicus sp. T]